MMMEVVALVAVIILVAVAAVEVPVVE